MTTSNVKTSVKVLALVLAAAVVAAACTSSAPPTAQDPTTSVASTSPPAPSTTASAAPDELVDPDTHTARTLRSIADFEQLARDGVGDQSVVKFSITEFSTDPEIEWLDSSFYSLHDEWYWFQLLNGTSVRGFDTEPPELDAGPFDTIAEVYDWAETRRDALPLDLRFTSLNRLYSPRFYSEGIDASPQRPIGLGSLIRSPDRDGGLDRWLIELEFSDEADADQIAAYFEVIAAAVPDDIAAQLFWVPRSPAQEEVAAIIERGTGPYRDQVIRYDDLAEPGDVEVYSSAIAAGRLLVVTDGGRWTLGDAGPDDIVAIDRAPDDLPPGNGLITGTPQTPLAHVNVLALNRGIPNAYLAGLADDATIAQLGRVRAKVLVQTTPDGELEIIPLTDEEYDGWRATQRREEIAVEAVDLAEVPLTATLDGLVAAAPTADDVDILRTQIGGKAAGFIELAVPGTTTMPTDPVVITVRPYIEHMTRFEPVVDALLNSADLDSPRLRYLVLEGRDDFDDRYQTPLDTALADVFTADHPAGTPLGDAIRADGFVELIRSSSIEPATLASITSALSSNFASLDPSQGLRFRSSSSVEDIEGFNGAGLYDSNTGFLNPTVLDDSNDHDRTVERAILRTWSSYWSATAFEERQRENVDDRSGAMAVLVHPRFDDDLEINNGVATVTINPNPDRLYEMTVNVQAGAVSVTNANNEDGLFPEVVRVVVEDPGATPQIERVTASSLATDGDVLSDDDVLALFSQLRNVADSWLLRANDEVPEDRRSSTLTLDFEFREMDAGWPARADGTIEPSRMVIKQARTLDPGLRAMRFELLALPIPRDVLAHAVSAIEYSCSATGDVGVRVLTDPLASVDLGYSDTPFELWGAGSTLTDLRGDVPLSSSTPDRLDVADCAQRDVIDHPTRYLLDILDRR